MIILAHKVEKAMKLLEFLATDKPGFPVELSSQPSPEELLEDDFGTEAFFRSTADVAAPEYTVAADFPELERLQALLRKYDKVFKPSSEPMDCEPMKVELIEGAQLRRQPLRHFPPKIEEEIAGEVERLLREGIIQRSKSAMVSAPVAARKADGALRMCIDLKYLNSLTKAEGYPMPRVDVSMRTLGDHKYYCKLDLRWGFNQMDLDEESRHLTAFATKSGLYEFKRVPFGLMNASGYYHNRVSDIVRPLPFVVPFLDDMAFGADSADEFLEKLEELLKKLASRGVVLKPSKCVFGASSLEYLGHIVSGEGVKLTDTRVRAVLKMPAPATETALRRFLGMANSFRTHIQNYSTLVRPLTALLGKNKPYEWSESCVQAFEKMRKAIADHAQLMWIDYSLPLVLRTDASQDGVGAVLLQVKDGVEHPVVFLSETFSDVATRLST
jgi:hypothetical protein